MVMSFPAVATALLVLLSSRGHQHVGALNLNAEPPLSRKPAVSPIRPNESANFRNAIDSHAKKFEFSHADQLASEARKRSAAARQAVKQDLHDDRIIRKQLDAFADDDEERRLYVGVSLGDKMNRDYVLDGNGYEMRAKQERTFQLKYYKMLGLDSLASQEEIKQSYRRLAKLYHPDANPNKDTSELFALLNRAYEVLSNPVLKLRYDKYGRRGLGTSASSDVFTSEKVQATAYGIGRGYAQYQQIARSDSADVNWKGSRADSPSNSPYHRLTMDLSKNDRTLFESRKTTRTVASARVVTQKTTQRDLYTVLSVHKTANDEEIRQAYTRLSELYYDDKDNDKESYIRYHEVQRAYEVLRDSKLRKKYDLHGFAGIDKIQSSLPRATIQASGGTRASTSVNPNPEPILANKKRVIPQNIVLASHQSTLGRRTTDPTPSPSLRRSTIAAKYDPVVEAIEFEEPTMSENFLNEEDDDEIQEPVPFPDLEPPAIKLKKTQAAPKRVVQVPEKPQVKDVTSAVVREIIDQKEADEDTSTIVSSQNNVAPSYNSAAYWRSVTQIDPIPLDDNPVLDKRQRIDEAPPVPFPDLQSKAPNVKPVLAAAKRVVEVQDKPKRVVEAQDKPKRVIEVLDTPKPVVEKVQEKPKRAVEVQYKDATSVMLREIIHKGQNEDFAHNSTDSCSSNDLAPIYGSAAYWRSVTQINPLPLDDDPVLDKRQRIEPVAVTGSNSKAKQSSSTRSFGRGSSGRTASRQLTQMHSMPKAYSSDQDRMVMKNISPIVPVTTEKRLLGISDQAQIVPRAIAPKSSFHQKSAPVQNQSRHYLVDC